MISHDSKFNNSDDPHRYDDIINLPYKKSTSHMPMSDVARAAQFSPFAALTGFESKIQDASDIVNSKE